MTLRRLPLLAACAALWLFLPAVPVLADGGPHNANINSGIGSLIRAPAATGFTPARAST